MNKQKTAFCARATICKKAEITKMILVSNGCPKFSGCEEFAGMGAKIKDKVLSINGVCTLPKCSRGNKVKVDTDCIDCRNLKKQSDGVSMELHLRCVNEYCYNAKKDIDDSCLECIECRILCTNRGASWVSFRGGKDIKGRNL